MPLPPDVRSALEAVAGPVRSVRPVGGGDVSHAARVETAERTVFVKWGRGDAGRTYAAEAAGLEALARAAGPGLEVPVPLAVRDASGLDASGLDASGRRSRAGVLVLPWLERGSPSSAGWRRFGAALAALHRADAPGAGYGWDDDNWIGSKPQRNGWAGSWPAFFGERRLRAQAETVRARGAWDAAWDPMLDRLVARLPEVLPSRPPRSLVHGDLWGGNALALGPSGPRDRAGPALEGGFALIDPAVYVGHREVDLAMTQLFGGFAPAFYDGYRGAWPFEPGYDERREVYNLFHLTNHLTHGDGYRRPVEAVLRRFGD